MYDISVGWTSSCPRAIQDTTLHHLTCGLDIPKKGSSKPIKTRSLLRMKIEFLFRTAFHSTVIRSLGFSPFQGCPVDMWINKTKIKYFLIFNIFSYLLTIPYLILYRCQIKSFQNDWVPLLGRMKSNKYKCKSNV